MSSNINENDFVSLVRIPRKWFYLFVWCFSVLIIANILVELLTDWAWKDLGETTSTRTANLMALIVGWFFILSHIWEVIMLGYAKMFKDRVFAEGRAVGIAEGIAEGKAEGKAEGIAEGIAEGKAEGIAEQYRLFREWNRRRIQAEKEGKEFTEPIPTPEDIINSDKS